MDLGLTDTVAVVTDPSKGIGWAVTRAASSPKAPRVAAGCAHPRVR